MSKMYYIIDNAGNLSKKSFYNNVDCFHYFCKHWRDYVVSVLSCDYISVYNENKYRIFDINTATGDIEKWKYFDEV